MLFLFVSRLQLPRGHKHKKPALLNCVADHKFDISKVEEGLKNWKFDFMDSKSISESE